MKKKLLVFTLLAALSACGKPDPIAFRAHVGMKKKEMLKLLGDPAYTGGFLASQDTTKAAIPRKDRFYLLYVYPDSSLVVLKHDTVYEIYGNVTPYKRALQSGAER